MSVVKNINLKFDDFIFTVDEIELPDEGVTAFLGPSGSGKTTLFNTLIGVYHPKDWSWKFKGEDLAQLTIDQRQLGVVFQTYDLFPHMTAEENVRIVYESRNKNGNFQHHIQPYIAKLNLEKCWNTKAHLLSGGEQQRVALLRALVSQPRVLLLDEPFSALDADLRAEARQLVKSLLNELQIPVFLITHDSEDVTALADYVVQVAHGGLKNVKKID